MNPLRFILSYLRQKPALVAAASPVHTGANLLLLLAYLIWNNTKDKKKRVRRNSQISSTCSDVTVTTTATASSTSQIQIESSEEKTPSLAAMDISREESPIALPPHPVPAQAALPTQSAHPTLPALPLLPDVPLSLPLPPDAAMSPQSGQLTGISRSYYYQLEEEDETGPTMLQCQMVRFIEPQRSNFNSIQSYGQDNSNSPNDNEEPNVIKRGRKTNKRLQRAYKGARRRKRY